MQASGFRSRLALGLAVLASAAAAVAVATASRAAGPLTVGRPPIGQTALEFVGRVHQEGASFTQYGYLTHIAGIPDAMLFSDPNLRDEGHARFTYYAKTALTARSVLDTLFALTTAGDTRFFFQASPSRQPTDAAAFAKGVRIGTYAGRIHDVVNVQSPNNGIATATESLTEKQSGVFTLGGRQYRFGGVGLRERLSATGEGKRSSTSPLVSDLIFAGDVVVTG
jgi:hypothetical protein